MEGSEKPAVLITGAGIGIGAATARAFADAGYRVVVTDVLEDEGRSVASDIGSGGGEAEHHYLDVTNTDEVDAVVADVLSEEHSLGPEGLERAAEFIPMGRVGEPADIADVILFLASESARYITGQVLVVDGGLLVGRY